jgi:hypothetical protein
MAHDDEQIRDTLVEPSLPPPLSPNVARGVIHRLLELEKVCQQARRQLLDDPITPQVAQDLFDKLLDATGAVRAELYDVLQRGGEDEEPDVFLEAFEHSTPNPPADHPITSFPKAAAVLDGLSNYCDPRYPELHQDYTPLPCPPAEGWATPQSGHAITPTPATCQWSTLPAPPSFATEPAAAEPEPEPAKLIAKNPLKAVLGALSVVLLFLSCGQCR